MLQPAEYDKCYQDIEDIFWLPTKIFLKLSIQ